MDPHARLRSQIRAGRELLNKNQSDIAGALDMSLSKISRAENGETKSGDILLEIKHGLERMGIRFTQSGVEIVETHVEIIEGDDCYLRLLDDVYTHLKNAGDKEFLVMFASERQSTPDVNIRYNLMLKSGLIFRKIISDTDHYIMGPLDHYRTMPERYFSNVVTLIYGNRVAQSSGGLKRITIHDDPMYAARERQIFSYFWNSGQRPETTEAEQRYG